MNPYVKKSLESLYKLGDTIDDISNRAKPMFPNMSSRDIMETEFTKYLLYLAGSDGNISQNSVDYINELFGWGYERLHFERLLTDFEVDFAEDIPLILRIFVAVDNAITNQAGSANPLNQAISLTLFNFYQEIGRNFLLEAGIQKQVGEFRLESFLSTINTFITCELVKNPVVPDTEQTEETDIPQPNQNSIKQADYIEESADSLLKELNDMIGLDVVKKDVNSLINLLKIGKIREQRGLSLPPMSKHLVFSGNPGTGKTTVARLLAKIYYHLGILSKGHLVEVDRSGLVGGFVGQTALKVNEVVEKALGGILFVDEAYSLTVRKHESDFGFEAVDVLLKAMEDHRDDLIVIVAGYPDLMEEFLQSNPGLRSRFNKFIYFENYTPDELLQIFESFCQKSGYKPSERCLYCAYAYFKSKALSQGKDFANARTVRNFFEQAITNQANRLASDPDITDVELCELLLDDVKNIA